MAGYSVLKDFTGLATAALIAWKLIVNNAINKAINVVMANTTQLIVVRYAKLCSHLFITSHARGEAIIAAITTSFKKSVESSATILVMLAPNTLRTPISFMRCSALNVANPNKPKQEIRMATIVKSPTIDESLVSAS